MLRRNPEPATLEQKKQYHFNQGRWPITKDEGSWPRGKSLDSTCFVRDWNKELRAVFKQSHRPLIPPEFQRRGCNVGV